LVNESDDVNSFDLLQKNFQKCLMRMFHEEGKGVVFMELVKNMKHQRHTVIECIPIPYGTVEDAPMYFQVRIFNLSKPHREMSNMPIVGSDNGQW
jgi:hypothetical protein